MDKVFIVARREFWETVKTKTFVISVVFMPLVIVGMIFATEYIANMAKDELVPTRRIAVIDSASVMPALEARVARYNEENPKQLFEFTASDQTTEELSKQVDSGELYAYLVVSEGAFDGSDACELGRADGQLQAGRTIERFVNDAIVELRFERADPPIELERIRALQARVNIRKVDTRSGLETSGNELAQIMTPFAFMFLLFMATMNISQGLLTSLIEEKSSKVVEVLLSAVSPTQLLAGKVVGMVAVGGMLILVWATVGYYGAQYRGVDYLVTPFRLIYMVLYFIPGFLLFAAALAAVGSACNTLKDAQSMSMPMTMVTMVPLMLWWYLTEHPNSTLAISLSYIPPITPFVMILRICSDPEIPMLQIVTTLGLLWASVVVVIWAAGRIFRVGVLMYGKPPSLMELIRWTRYA